MEFEQIKTAFIAKKTRAKEAEEKYEKKIAEAEKAALQYHALVVKKHEQARSLQAAKNRIRVSWIDEFVIPVVKEVNALLGTRFVTKDLRTYGLRAECPVFDRGKMSLTFTIMKDGDDYRLFIDTGKKNRACEPGSLAALNGMDNVSEEVTSIDTIISNLKRRYPDNF